LLATFFVCLDDARVILAGHNGRNAKPPPLSEHHFKAWRHNGRVFIHDAQIGANADGVRGQRFQHVSGITFCSRSKADSAGVADCAQTDLAKVGKFSGRFFQRWQGDDQDTPLKNRIREIHFAIFHAVNMGVGVCQAGERSAEIALGIAVLLCKRWRLVFHFPACYPAGIRQGILNGFSARLSKFWSQSQCHTFFNVQRISDHIGGQFDQAFIPQIHEGIHNAGDQCFSLAGKNTVPAVRGRHQRHEELRKPFGVAHGKRIIGI